MRKKRQTAAFGLEGVDWEAVVRPPGCSVATMCEIRRIQQSISGGGVHADGRCSAMTAATRGSYAL
jgi:hypothetical protein